MPTVATAVSISERAFSLSAESSLITSVLSPITQKYAEKHGAADWTRGGDANRLSGNQPRRDEPVDKPEQAGDDGGAVEGGGVPDDRTLERPLYFSDRPGEPSSRTLERPVAVGSLFSVTRVAIGTRTGSTRGPVLRGLDPPQGTLAFSNSLTCANSRSVESACEVRITVLLVDVAVRAARPIARSARCSKCRCSESRDFPDCCLMAERRSMVLRTMFTPSPNVPKPMYHGSCGRFGRKKRDSLRSLGGGIHGVVDGGERKAGSSRGTIDGFGYPVEGQRAASKITDFPATGATCRSQALLSDLPQLEFAAVLTLPVRVQVDENIDAVEQSGDRVDAKISMDGLERPGGFTWSPAQ